MKIKYGIKREIWVPCTKENIFLGATVKRGKDWDWGDQDAGKLGIIDEMPYKDPSGEFWASVEWKTGNRNGYRVFQKKDLLIKLN